MANISTAVPVTVTPLVVADAERFSAEYDWPGGVPPPNVILQSADTYSVAIDNATLAANGALQTYSFQTTTAVPYSFLITGLGVSVDGGTLTTAEQDAFWTTEVTCIFPPDDYGSMRIANLSNSMRMDPAILNSRCNVAIFGRDSGYRSYFVRGSNFATGIGITLEVAAWVSATGQTGYPFIRAMGWPDRVRDIGSLRLPTLFQ